MNAITGFHDIIFDDEQEIILDVPETFRGVGIYYSMTNEDYHSGPGISKSGLDMIAANPSSFVWSKKAPVDHAALAALDFGTALHCALLEPSEFEKRFVMAPEFNRRTTAGREQEAEFMAHAYQCGFTPLTAEEAKKLSIMRDSVMAHPVARMIFEAEGYNEASIYWNDAETNELCRIRPDRMPLINGFGPLIVDVKKIDGMDRFAKHVAEFRYHVQNAMYCDGYQAHFGEIPEFWFLAVSSSISAGRYEVDVKRLDPEFLAEGYELYRRDLNAYAACRQADDWLHVSPVKRPRWA